MYETLDMTSEARDQQMVGTDWHPLASSLLMTVLPVQARDRVCLVSHPGPTLAVAQGCHVTPQ